MEPIVNIEVVWEIELPSGDPCAACNDPIFSHANVLYLVVNDKKVSTNICVCNSCFDLIKKDAI